MINSVLKAIKIMQLFNASAPRLTLVEISQALNLPKSTAHNLLATLQSQGFIERTDDDRYALGKAIIALTQAVRVNVELRDRAAPLLRKLADTCRESVYLTVLEGDYVLYIYAVESPHRLLARTAVGDRVHPHCTSVGKAILAALPLEKVEEIIERVGLPAFTRFTITDFETLSEELARTRSRGYAIDHEEHEEGIYCIGAPIYNERGRVIASCSIAGVDPTNVDERVVELSSLVRHTAQEISRRMGFVPDRLSSVRLLPTESEP